MTAALLDGQALADQFKDAIRTEIESAAASGAPPPGLGTILVGDDPASHSYVGAKIRDCAEVGIASVHRPLPADVSQAQLDDEIAALNADPAVHAYIVQLPLPSHLDEPATLAAVDPAKDADGLHPLNLGRLVMGAPAPLPCTPRAILEMLAHYDVPVEGRHVVVIGRGLTIGRPLALLLALRRTGANAAVTVVHTGVADLAEHTRRADVLVAAAGKPGLVTPEMVKPGAAVVGAGITRDGRRIVSDVDESVAEVAGWITPRLGGVGPMTRAMLLRNTVDAAAAAAPPAEKPPR
ncbi:MAG TPA: bifunctional 5,10-methylene-tetrahydrofolate dehydrogenase/5,10-methylene-tetrahydrofolate cyclohydrolase [Acidimicrobiaceae bacterium]|nr:bifunctional 5,10-methylene-tetrahydrofolate dehydrogenase/5,10-methylene-tetrahydrofolate cyclohydrolase [Acidimicrobiaceae bacterium]HCB37453.1 bifunctional 5,10-methylene-tetrahydrofolate dehydrogenase/5,10-methylene-tetrahydrofolate cyclohydrolase [Acidimicrobiaceae bacterium]